MKDLLRNAYGSSVQCGVTISNQDEDSGHIDFYVPEERKIALVKVVSNGVADLPYHEHMLQAQACLHYFRKGDGSRFCDDAEIVYVLWGQGFLPEVCPVRYREDVAREIEEELKYIHAMVQMEQIPPVPAQAWLDQYPCSWKNRAGLVQCRFWEYCWSGIQSSAIPKVDDIKSLLSEYVRICDSITSTNRMIDTLKEEKKAFEQALDEYFNKNGYSSIRTDEYILKRVPVAGRDTWNVDAAIEAGVVSREALEPFRKKSAGYTRWFLSKA